MNLRSTLFALAGAAAIVACARPAAAAEFSPYMAGLSVGGGVTDFRDKTLRNDSSTGGSWDARLIIGTRTPIAFEAEYLGSSQKESDASAPQLQPILSTTQVTGDARLNLTRGRIQPFLVGGAGWVNMHSFGRSDAPIAAADWSHNGNGLVLPMGGGIGGYIGKHAMVDARFTYRLIVGEKDFNSVSNARPDMWNAGLNAGYAF